MFRQNTIYRDVRGRAKINKKMCRLDEQLGKDDYMIYMIISNSVSWQDGSGDKAVYHQT